MIKFTITDEHQIIVPLAFRRGTDDEVPESDAPELDDRGFLRGQAQSGLGASDARGPMVGLMENFPVRLRIEREDIDPNADIYVTATDPLKIEIVEPAGGGPIQADDVFKIRGKDAKGAAGKIQARLGSADGPVLGELEPHIFNRLKVPLQLHLVTINSASGNGTEPVAPLDKMVKRIRAIWWPCGIELVYDTTVRPIAHDTITLTNTDLCEPWGADNAAEIKKILNLQNKNPADHAASPPDPALHWYVVQNFRKTAQDIAQNREWWGWGVSRTSAGTIRSTYTGIVTSTVLLSRANGDEMLSKLVAHEIGHFFGLQHAENRNYDNPALDTSARRMLMYPNLDLSPFAAGATLDQGLRFNNVGYGDKSAGCLVTIKRHLHHGSDGETMTARNTIRGGNWM